MNNISVKLYKGGPVAQERCRLKIFSLQLLRPFCSSDRDYLCNSNESIMRNISVKLFRI